MRIPPEQVGSIKVSLASTTSAADDSHLAWLTLINSRQMRSDRVGTLIKLYFLWAAIKNVCVLVGPRRLVSGPRVVLGLPGHARRGPGGLGDNNWGLSGPHNHWLLRGQQGSCTTRAYTSINNSRQPTSLPSKSLGYKRSHKT